jgi:hypothetical protein
MRSLGGVGLEVSRRGPRGALWQPSSHEPLGVSSRNWPRLVVNEPFAQNLGRFPGRDREAALQEGEKITGQLA